MTWPMPQSMDQTVQKAFAGGRRSWWNEAALATPLSPPSPHDSVDETGQSGVRLAAWRSMMAELSLRYLAEGAGAWLVFGLFRLLPLDWASALGRLLARNIG